MAEATGVGDHGGVVGTQFGGRRGEGDVHGLAHFSQCGADGGIGGDTSGRDESGGFCLFQRQFTFFGEDGGDLGLQAGGDIGGLLGRDGHAFGSP